MSYGNDTDVLNICHESSDILSHSGKTTPFN